ncbi:ABC transporter G family member 19 [Fusarium oxysporum f. sp. albedinis]|nr:ABC transporter G family member 19 [Fusarium oxysporum f. sp. albedinis]
MHDRFCICVAVGSLNDTIVSACNNHEFILLYDSAEPSANTPCQKQSRRDMACMINRGENQSLTAMRHKSPERYNTMLYTVWQSAYLLCCVRYFAFAGFIEFLSVAFSFFPS